MGYQFKICELCPIEINEAFVINFKPKEYTSLHGVCRSCRKKLRKYQNIYGGKVCVRCCRDLPFGNFPFHKKTYDGFDSWCKECRNIYRSECNQSLDTHLRAILSRMKEDRRKIPYSLNLSDLIDLYKKQDGRCAISNEIMTYQRTKRMHNAFNISLDRIDSSKNYDINNVQLVCWMANRMKGEHSLEDLIKWCDKIIKYNT